MWSRWALLVVAASCASDSEPDEFNPLDSGVIGDSSGDATDADASDTDIAPDAPDPEPETLVVQLRWQIERRDSIACSVSIYTFWDESIYECDFSTVLTVEQFREIALEYGDWGCTANESENLGEIECINCTSTTRYCSGQPYEDVYCSYIPSDFSIFSSCNWSRSW